MFSVLVAETACLIWDNVVLALWIWQGKDSSFTVHLCCYWSRISEKIAFLRPPSELWQAWDLSQGRLCSLNQTLSERVHVCVGERTPILLGPLDKIICHMTRKSPRAFRNLSGFISLWGWACLLGSPPLWMFGIPISLKPTSKWSVHYKGVICSFPTFRSPCIELG